MGALHEGHLRLVREARKECDTLVVSIFVNPTQFDDPEDLEHYPRDPEGDAALLEEEGVDILFMPSRQEVYPEERPQPPDLDLSSLEGRMEGAHRPGHFLGVVMVLDRLFAMVRPHRAYFGEKDYQQLLVVRSLVEQRGWDLNVRGVPIVRESNGLALSSRNQRLSEGAKERASMIYEGLCWMRSEFERKGIRELKDEVRALLQNAGMQVDYVEVADARTLEGVEDASSGKPVRGFIAASIEGVRLIDNLPLDH